MSSKVKFDSEANTERLMKIFETCTSRIKTIEVYTKDKYVDATEQIKLVDQKISSLATLEHIDKVYEA